MGKIAFMFSGQGAQYPGMGKELCDASAAAQVVFDLADQSRPDTSTQCFEGSKEELQRTVNTQPCVYCVDLAAAEALREAGITPDAVAGFSLGEVAALTFAGWYTPQDGFQLVCRRAKLMDDAAAEVETGMAAVMRLDNEKIEALCREHKGIYPVNYNCPGQLVVAGEKDLLPAFMESVAAAGGKALPLAVSGGFHSPYMDSAAEGLSEVLAEIPPREGRLSVYSNATAERYQMETASQLLAKQVNHPVRWQTIIETMISEGFDTFVEVGPGKTLAGLVRKIDKSVRTCGVENKETLDAAIALLKGE